MTTRRRRGRWRDGAFRERTLIIGLLLLALCLRLGWMVAFKAYEFDTNWDAGYEQGMLADSIAHGHGLALTNTTMIQDRSGTHPTAWFGPVYPLILGAVFKLFGSYTPTALVVGVGVNCLLGALIGLPLHGVAARVFGARVGMMSLGIWAVFPQAVIHSTRLSQGVPLVLVFVTALWCLARWHDSPGLKWAVAAGAMMGLALLTDGVVAGLLPVIAIWMLLPRPIARGTRWMSVAGFAVCVVCVLTPWTIRNYRLFDEFLPLRTTFGLNLFKGNNWYADGKYSNEVPIVARALEEGRLTEADHARLLTAGEIEYSRVLGEISMRWIADHPGTFLRLTATRVFYFWFQPLGTRQGGQWSSPVWTMLFVGYVGLLLTAIAGFITSARSRRARLLQWSVVVFPLPYYLTVSTFPRYVFPIYVFLSIFAATFATSCIARRAGRPRPAVD